MAKTSGGVRSLGKRHKAKENRFTEFRNKLKTGNYKTEYSYFNRASGGFVLFHKEHN